MPAKRCACPMAMPPETPMPCIVKLTADGAARVPSGLMGSLRLVELVGEELLDRVGRRRLVGPFGLELDRRPHSSREHHHAHDALRIDAPAVALDPDAALELRRRLRELGRGAR